MRIGGWRLNSIATDVGLYQALLVAFARRTVASISICWIFDRLWEDDANLE